MLQLRVVPLQYREVNSRQHREPEGLPELPEFLELRPLRARRLGLLHRQPEEEARRRIQS